MADNFTDRAKDWDAREMVRNLSIGIGSAILKNVELNNQMAVMDFGAGTGLIAAQVSPLVQKVTAVDTSEAMLEKLLAKEELAEQIDTLCQDIIHNPISTRYDLIMSAMAMHHVEDTNLMVQRFAEHLQPNGRVALADLDKEDGTFHPATAEDVFHAGFDREQFTATLEFHGFTNIRFHDALTVERGGKSYPVFLVIATKG